MKHLNYYSVIDMFIFFTRITKPLAIITLLTGSTQFCMAAPQAATGSRIKQGNLLMEQGHYQQAYEQFFTEFNENPGDMRLDFLLGKAAYAAKDYESAVMAFERITMVDSGSTAARIELAKSFFMLGSKNQAKEMFTQILGEELPDMSRVAIEEFLNKIE